jgi:hypothetical protein
MVFPAKGSTLGQDFPRKQKGRRGQGVYQIDIIWRELTDCVANSMLVLPERRT